MGDPLPDGAKNRIRDAFYKAWPNLAGAIDSYQFPDANPSPLLAQIAAMTEGAEKAMFRALLDCFDSKVGTLSSELARCHITTQEYDHDLTRAQKMIEDQESTIEDLKATTTAQKMSLDARTFEINNLNSKVTELNNQRSLDNDRVSRLMEEKSTI